MYIQQPCDSVNFNKYISILYIVKTCFDHERLKILVHPKILHFVIVNWHADFEDTQGVTRIRKSKKVQAKGKGQKKKKTAIPRLQKVVDNYEMKA